jgi:hypothetical protein
VGCLGAHEHVEEDKGERIEVEIQVNAAGDSHDHGQALDDDGGPGQPVISIDTKKKELIGPYKNGGSDYRPEGCPDKSLPLRRRGSTCMISLTRSLEKSRPMAFMTSPRTLVV